MVDKSDLVRVSEYAWEVPQSYRPDMRVPARIYASEKLLKMAFQDETMKQLVNTAAMPGVIKRVLVMPDAHQGYGPPIGGVVPTRYPDGVISPGAVGYDINCLSGDTPVLHDLGYRLPIGDMGSTWPDAELACQDLAAGRATATPVSRFLELRPTAPVYRLTTASGRQIVATADHPFWTPDGMHPLGQLQTGDRVALYNFEGVDYEPASDAIVVDGPQIERLFFDMGKGGPGNSLAQTLAYLDKRGLLPLRYSSPQLPYLTRLAGYVLGDGALYFSGKKKQGTVWFYGDADDLESIRADVKRLGFAPSPIYVRERAHHIQTTYGDYEFSRREMAFKVTSTAFASLLVCLGVPAGNKAAQDFDLPPWLPAAPRWQKRLFLAALFGADLSTPKAFAKRSHNFYAPVFAINKRQSYVDSGLSFLAGLASLLAEFEVETKAVTVRQEQQNVDGTRSYRLRLILSSRPQSLLNLWERVGFDYNTRRRALGCMAAGYLHAKQAVTAERARVAARARAMHGAGISPSRIYAQLAGPLTNRRFLERSLYEDREQVRIGSVFPGFDEWCQQATAGLGHSGMVWDRIAGLEELVDWDAPVYDFTVAHPDHNFVAGGFVVSNCGVRLMASELMADDVKNAVDDLISALYYNIPSGVGKGGGTHKLSPREMDEVMVKGAAWAVKAGYGRPEDLERLEEGGAMAGADPAAVSARAKERGAPQLGTLGSGNHFVEMQEVVEIYDPEVARAFGLFQGQLVVQIHSGSRGFGHQVCDDYVKSLQSAVQKYNIQLPDRQLVCAPLDSPEGKRYWGAMVAAANYAWANRQCMAHLVRQGFETVLAGKVRKWDLHTVYDVCHNIAKLEDHVIDGKKTRVCVHRKGATRAFGPGHPAITPLYRAVGQPVLVPGDMGTASYVLVGTAEAMEESFGTSCHGAGRTMSRAAAKKRIRGSVLRQELEAQGIHVRAGSMEGLAEEAPEAYKDIDDVIEVVHGAGLARKVARMRPLAVMKG